MTERLYWADSHLRSFDARVLSCRESGGRWEVTLTRTAFFPEGGGQKADGGTLGGAAVLDVQERADEIVHFCGAPLGPGSDVRGVLDWEARFARMQSHSGEHIVSGIAHRLWGCRNVGFHLAETVTIDFDRELAGPQLAELERRANEAVWADLPVRTWFPAPEELSGLDYRSKKELAGPVRLVEIEGIDRCACCAPHVDRTGEIGLLRLTDAMRHRGGVRLTLLAGRAAYEDAAARSSSVDAVSRLLSVPRGDVTAGVERLLAERDALRAERAAREQARLAARAAALPETAGNLCLFEGPDTGGGALRELVNAGAQRCGGVCAAFAGSDETGWRYIIGSRHVDLRAAAGALNAALRGRGGGSPEMLQGSAAASRAEIEAYFGG